MLDCIGLESLEGSARIPDDMPYRPIIDRYRTTWSDFKEFTCSAAHGAVVHALAQLRSHYPIVDLQWVVIGYARATNANKLARLEDEAEESAKRLAEDVELFGEGRSSAP